MSLLDTDIIVCSDMFGMIPANDKNPLIVFNEGEKIGTTFTIKNISAHKLEIIGIEVDDKKMDINSEVAVSTPRLSPGEVAIVRIVTDRVEAVNMGKLMVHIIQNMDDLLS